MITFQRAIRIDDAGNGKVGVNVSLSAAANPPAVLRWVIVVLAVVVASIYLLRGGA